MRSIGRCCAGGCIILDVGGDVVKLKAGDRVTIVSNIPKCIAHHKRKRGTVRRVDGAYIYVRPDHYRHEVEFYPCELENYGDSK
jgi:hypothetical protein